MMEIMEDPRFWVALAFVLFVAISYKKIAGLLTTTLDERSAKIKSELEEAKRLRTEAEILLNSYRAKQAHNAQEAENIMAEARRDADILRTRAEEEIKATMEGRMNQAVARIAQEEAKAVADVRNHVVDIALAAARKLITDHVSSMSQEDLIALAMSDIERKVH